MISSRLKPELQRLLAVTVIVLATLQPEVDRLIDFQQYHFGVPPSEFEYDATGPHGPVLTAGRPLWRTYVDLFAPSPKFVLIQSSALAKLDHYPIALLPALQATNLKLAVSFKLLSGNLTRSAGILWRARDKNNYSALLADDLSHQVRLVRMKEGQPSEFASARTELNANDWNSLELSIQGDRLAIWMNECLLLETRDQESGAVGRVGLITQADTIALFDDFYVQRGTGRIVRKIR